MMSVGIRDQRVFGFVVAVVTVQAPEQSGRLPLTAAPRIRSVPRKSGLSSGARKKHS